MRRFRTACCVAATLVCVGVALLSSPTASADSPIPICDPPAYAGVWHCRHTVGEAVVSVVLVDLNDPRVHLGTALPGFMDGAKFVECKSVNPAGRDPSSNCPGDKYPLERIPTMLRRYRRRGAVVAINADYFGFVDQSHGAEGLTVRAGHRLDGPAHNGNSGVPFIRSYMAVARDSTITFGRLIPGYGRFDLAGEFFNTVSGGPMLAQRGIVLPNEAACLAEQLPPEACLREYQTVAGIASAGHALVLAVGRRITAADLARFLVETYGVATAIKFDGGGSAQMAWLDALGNVRGFDAEIEVNDGFRPVAEGLLVFSTPLPLANAEAGPALEFVWSLINREAAQKTCRVGTCAE
ncbi:MAG: phosphodiester glycosidase family protein [Chloroflexi bacterium]|nr:phosphodiester glycosidase family protein [Chloroflexota bacterium]